MAFALNIVALLLVLGLSWAAMMWLSGRFHGASAHQLVADREQIHDDIEVPHARGPRDLGASARQAHAAPCAACEGVGAHHKRGRLQPCPTCRGTGTSELS